MADPHSPYCLRINKAIIVHDQGREDLLLQVNYEGPLEEFGWLIPLPSQPKVEKGSMEPFYELSQLTQRTFGGSATNGITTLGTDPFTRGSASLPDWEAPLDAASPEERISWRIAWTPSLNNHSARAPARPDLTW